MTAEQGLNLGVPNFLRLNSLLCRGGQPTDEGWNALKAIGVRTVVKLNTAGEAQDVGSEALGMKVVYCPIDLDQQLLFKPNRLTVQAAVNAMGPNTFVHCEHGQDRTGLIVGCYRVWQCGWTKDAAWAEMRQCGFHPELLGLTLFWEFGV